MIICEKNLKLRRYQLCPVINEIQTIDESVIIISWTNNFWTTYFGLLWSLIVFRILQAKRLYTLIGTCTVSSAAPYHNDISTVLV